jgi:hypothetical protein
MRSNALMHVFDRDPSVRTQITAHGARLEAMEARADLGNVRDTGLRGVRSNVLPAFDRKCVRTY